MTARQMPIYQSGADAFYAGEDCNPPYSATLGDIQNRCLWVAGYYDAKVWGVK